MLVDGFSRADYYILQAIAARVAKADEPAQRGGLPTIKDTCFPSYKRISEDSCYGVRHVAESIARLTGTETNNPTGKPYLTIEKCPVSQVNRYRINVPLFDMMSKKDADHSEPVAVTDADDIDLDVPTPHRVFLPVDDSDPANRLARKYWDKLSNNPIWGNSGSAWEDQFRKKLETHTYEQLSSFIEWGFADQFWAEKARSAKHGQDKVPYLLKKDTAFQKFLETLKRKPASSVSSTTTHRDTAARLGSRRF